MVKSDYNDGKWHQWHNDSEIPIHPRSLIDFITPSGLVTSWVAEDCQWADAFEPIIAFSVAQKFEDEPKVGDSVSWNGEGEYTLLYIHNSDPDRKYGVISFRGDIPRGVHYDELRLV